MKLKLQRIFGGALILTGFIFILNSLSSITGFIISQNLGKGVGSIFGLVFIICGILIFVSSREVKEGNLAKQLLENGAIVQDSKKLRKIAKKVGKQEGYFGREVEEGYQILNKNKKPLTVIPRHNISAGVYRSIMNALVTGESNFRKRTAYSSN